jgi:hypothetical protein
VYSILCSKISRITKHNFGHFLLQGTVFVSYLHSILPMSNAYQYEHGADASTAFQFTNMLENIVPINPFRSYVGPRPTLWFSCSRLFSWSLTHFNPIFLPSAYSPALIYFGRERSWWITCNYPTVLKEKNRNRKSTTCAICWLKSVLQEEKRREQENHNVGLRHYD